MGFLIQLDKVNKAYQTEAGEFLALNNVSLEVEAGEFVAVIGKSGSGKSTLINMITGIDRSTSGIVEIAGTNIVGLSEGQMAEWRGRSVGIVFQFFQLLPTLTVLENVMLPMDFCRLYTPPQRLERAATLLELVEISSLHHHKLPSQLSGGQQQRVAIARALANDPQLIAADEPTGNLDSKTAELIFQLFSKLVSEGKTVIMVTHDRDLSRRVERTLVISDGEIIEQYLSKTFPGLTEKQLVWITRQLKRRKYAPGQVILKKGDPVGKLYIITKGIAEVVIQPSNKRQIVAAELGQGKYFGEIELIRGQHQSLATVRASTETPTEVVEISQNKFQELLERSPQIKTQFDTAAQRHFQEHQTHRRKV